MKKTYIYPAVSQVELQMSATILDASREGFGGLPSDMPNPGPSPVRRITVLGGIGGGAGVGSLGSIGSVR